MKQINDGGPAFPTHEDGYENGHAVDIYHSGMSLRDWYAGMALTGMVAHYGNDGDPGPQAYAIADQMLKVRDEP